MNIPFGDLRRQYESIRPELDAAAARVLASGWYILGPEVQAFERAFAAFCGVGHAVGVGNGTEALYLALVALGVGPGDEVITVANAAVYEPLTYHRTAALLDSLPLLDIPGRGPNAFLSRLAPRTRIPAHNGVTNARVTVHLPLIVPPGCGFRVGPETREWVAGKAWVFDDTIEHEAWNDSDEPRLILIFDIWNPCLDAAERDHLRRVLGQWDRHYRRADENAEF